LALQGANDQAEDADSIIWNMTTSSEQTNVAVSIVTWNSAGEIRDCLTPLAGLPTNWQVWVVDNNSSDDTVEIVKEEFPFVNRIANPDNRGFAEANNQVIRQTDTDFVLLLNPDTEADVSGLQRSLEIINERPEIGMLGVRLCHEDGSLQETCFPFPTPWKNLVEAFSLYRIYSKERTSELFANDFFEHDRAREVDWIKGAFMLVRRSAIDKAGALPEDYFMFAEDMDWCWQLRQSGYRIWFSPDVLVKHKSNKSAGQMPSIWRMERTLLSKYLFCFKNFGGLSGRFIQLSDLFGVSYKILRNRVGRTRPKEIAVWRMARKVIAVSIFTSRREIVAKLKERQ